MVLIKGIPWAYFESIGKSPNHTYYCVSHVWGEYSEKTVPGVEKEGKPFKALLNNNPAKLRWIREIHDSQDYYWMDIYSIDQEDDTDKSAQVEQMDDIFDGCYKCFILLEDDEDCFLIAQGVDIDTLGDNENMIIETSNGTRGLVDMYLVERLLSESPIHSRIWTFQEFILSNNKEFVVCSRHYSIGGFKRLNTESKYVKRLIRGDGTLERLDKLRLVFGDLVIEKVYEEEGLILTTEARRGAGMLGNNWTRFCSGWLTQGRSCSILKDQIYGVNKLMNVKIDGDYSISTNYEVMNQWLRELRSMELIPSNNVFDATAMVSTGQVELASLVLPKGDTLPFIDQILRYCMELDLLPEWSKSNDSEKEEHKRINTRVTRLLRQLYCTGIFNSNPRDMLEIFIKNFLQQL